MNNQETFGCMVCFTQMQKNSEAVSGNIKINAELTLCDAIESQKMVGNVRITHN
jgi:hypothetical protein